MAILPVQVPTVAVVGLIMDMRCTASLMPASAAYRASVDILWLPDIFISIEAIIEIAEPITVKAKITMIAMTSAEPWLSSGCGLDAKGAFILEITTWR